MRFSRPQGSPRIAAAVAMAMAMVIAAIAVSAENASKSSPPPATNSNGVTNAPAFAIPLSRYISDETRRLFTEPSQDPPVPLVDWRTASIEDIRKSHDDTLAPTLARIRAAYPVDIVDRKIANVPTRVITPKQGVAPRNQHRLLLNLHGGGFFIGANAEALVESIPVASVSATQVITIDYRQGPEHRFPAASDDVIAVYRELLKDHAADNIGMYGCSAGGALAAMTSAALQKTDLPQPGAIGIFSAGAYANWIGDPRAKGTWGGDSRYWAPPVLGQPATPLEQPPFTAESAAKSVTTAYISNVDPADPYVSPGESPALLARFPPTLVLTGTRAYDLSAAVETHRQLIRSGVEADLHLWDGMGHCFFFEAHLPESREAFDVMTRFFDKHLGTAAAPAP